MSVRILVGDCREILRTLPDESVHCVVTSPPYWGLRDYGVAGQIGLETSLSEFVAEMVNVFAEVRRILVPEGTLWLNLGDCYANDGKFGGQTGGKQAYLDDASRQRNGRERRVSGLKPKNLCGIPWRVAFALQENGWFLRQDIIWSKPNPMPESVTDRCTKAHEYLFLLSKSEQYFYDADAIKERAADRDDKRPFGDAGGNRHGDEERIYKPRKIKMPDGWDTGAGGHGSYHRKGREKGKTREVTPRHAAYESCDRSSLDDVGRGMLRNKRSVWEVATSPFPGAHFATFPPTLIEPCILAGCPTGGGSPGPVRRRRHNWPRRRSPATRRHLDRAKPRICRHGTPPSSRRFPLILSH